LIAYLPDERLIQVLVNALMLWMIGSQPISIDCDMHETIALGIGHLIVATDEMFDTSTNYPVFIAEPLTILSLSSLFEKQEWTQRKTWMNNSLSTSRNKSSLGCIFEETLLFLFMEKFGSKFTALGDVFHFSESSSLARREVTLVSLMRRIDGAISCCEVSWNAGSSDRFGFKAQSVEDVLRYLNDPRGKAFLFPHSCMGPDLICFFQDKETQELILLLLQAKSTPTLNASIWLDALNSITPEFFYTITVRLRPFVSYYIALLLCL
jgi:hypothetical protein